MKKTLIALMVLAGSAFAVEPITQDLTFGDFNSTLTQISTLNVTEYTLSLTITGTDFNGNHNSKNINILTLGNNRGIFTQAGQYIAVRNDNTTETGWIAPTKTEGTTFTWVSADTDNLLHSWVSKTPEGGNAAPGAAGLTITIDVGTSGSVITLGMTNGTTSVIETGYVVKLADVSLIDGSADGGNQGVTGISNASITYAPAPVPEPTTATLSLLALAGLAARRRRH